MIEIVEAGPLATLQDLGRPGLAALGVPRSGAFDRAAAAQANRLVGNPADQPVIELTLGGLAFATLSAVTVALTGALCGGALDWGVPVSLPAGTEVRLGRPPAGLRSYLAVRGGFAGTRVLGSCSTDRLSGLGPAPLSAGDRLALGTDPGTPISDARAHPVAPVPLQLRPGPRADWFSGDALAHLVSAAWQVRSDSDRIGVRLDGPALQRRITDELPSEATRPGAVQVPPDGRPIIFGPDAPVTGGYPVIALVANLDAAAQLRPGDESRFVLA